jgi:WD40 repeat protein
MEPRWCGPCDPLSRSGPWRIGLLGGNQSGRQHPTLAGGGGVRVSDARTGTERLTFTGHGRAVRSVVISSDGSNLASASDDGNVRVWDARARTERLTLTA